MFPDLKAALGGGTSLYPGLRTSGSGGITTGDWVDLNDTDGPAYGSFQTGVSSGSGSYSQSVSCKLQEADDNSGTGVQDVSGDAVTISGNKGWGMFRGIRTKRWVRAVITVTTVGSAGPIAVNDISASVFAQKQRF